MNKSVVSKVSAPSLDHLLVASSQHLERTSQLLLTTSPAISAYVGGQKNALSARQHQVGVDSNYKRCVTCGAILIPGWSCKKHRPRPVASKRITAKKNHDRVVKSSQTKKQVQTDLAYECDLCHGVSRFEIPRRRAPKPAASIMATLNDSSIDKTSSSAGQMTTAPAVQPLAPVSEIPGQVTAKPATEGPSKRRAKKSKNGGLAALLAQKKSQNASPAATASAGFDLMDFMKTA